jgi:hypothetical protein
MSNNLIPYADMEQMAQAMVKSNLFGMKDVNQVIALGLVAQADGMPFASAVRDYDIILGRPALKSASMQARFQAAGGKVEWKVYTDSEVTGIFSHPNGGSLELTWTIEQATKIGLVKPNSGWSKYPRAMLRARCLSEGIRTVFPGCLGNMYAPEEVIDFEPQSAPILKPKNMGIVTKLGDEVVTIENLKEDIIKGIPMYIPGSDEPYAQYLTNDDWIDGYAEMHAKIHESTKLSKEEKEEKIHLLRSCNDTYTKTFDGNTVAKFLSKLNIHRKEIANG